MKLFSHIVSLTLILLANQVSGISINEREVSSSAEGFELAKEVSEPSASNQPSKPVVDGVGTKDAPIDGRDGRPHSGPFVETSAERDRKKAKESGDQTSPSKSEKAPSAEGLPASNDGVMDDPNRKGPREGTRGTEGGISEKTKDGKEDKKDSSEKIPDPPKEAPPLPHSEQKKIEKEAGKIEETTNKEALPEGSKKEEGKKDDKSKQLGGLEVGPLCLPNFFVTDPTETRRPSQETS